MGLPALVLLACLPAAAVTYFVVRRYRTSNAFWAVRIVNGEFKWIVPRVVYDDAVNEMFDQQYRNYFPDQKRPRPREIIRLYSPHELFRMIQMFPERRLMSFKAAREDISTWGRVYVLLIACSFIAILVAQCTEPPDVSSIIPGG